MINKNDVIQFTENHKWCGCLGIVVAIKTIEEEKNKYLIGVPIPMQGQGTAYIFDDGSNIEKVGTAILTWK